MTNMTRNHLLTIAATVALGLGCGGSQKKAGLGGAPPPPNVDGPQKIDRTVSREAKKDFAEAVAYYKKQDEAGWNKDRCRDAAEKFQDVASSHSKLIEARFNAGMAYQKCGMNKAAEEQYRTALKINKAHAPTIANLGKIYWDRGNEGAAKQYWDQANKVDQKLAAPHNNLAWLIIREIRERKGNTDVLEAKALRHLQSALAVENDNVEAYVLLALLYMEGSEKNRSRLTLAELLLDKAKERDESFPALWNARGLLLMRRENPAEALNMFARAIELDPKFVEARLNAGNIVLDFRKYQEAQSHFEAVLEIEPKSYDAMIGLGMAQRAQKQFDAATASYKKAQGLEPNRAEADFNLGILSMSFISNETEDLRKAQSAYRTALGHFRKVMTKTKVTADLKKESQTNIALCEKAIKSLDEAIRMQAQAASNK
jgi:tetratricopeptide (TPR) repeat protein